MNDDHTFADSSSRKRRKHCEQDLTKPVSFVSTGTFMPNEDKVDDNKQEQGLGQEGSVDVGKFESYYTKGMGMKLMEKMGYKGGGLGKNEQGILNPIEAKLRTKYSGLGFNNSKETITPLPALETEKKSEPGEGVQPIVGRKKRRALLKRLKKQKEGEVSVTAEGMLVSQKEQESEVVQKIYDMRGPQTQVYTNLSDLNAEEKAKEKDVPMPELQHNKALVVQMTEADIRVIDRDLQKERDIRLGLKREKEKLEAEAAFQNKQLDNYENTMSMLDRVRNENALALDSLAQYFRHMHKRYIEYYKSCKLACVAYSYAMPLFIRVFQGWDPLRNPSHGLELVSEWKTLLQGDDCFDIQDISSPYTHLVSEVVLPAVRISGINTWHTRDPEPMLRFLDSWEKLLPSSVLATILDTIVMPKLLRAVDTWEPHRETIPIHTWVHPWLPLLGHKMEREGIYRMVRYKLSNVLGAWHPSDGSAYAILSPWKTVFDSDRWQQLMCRYIVPKLKVVLRDDFQVNPASQRLDQFYWVMNWASAIPIHLMVDIMQIFFTKWLTVLYHWLCSNPNYGEVRKWYLDWKELIPKELLENESIQYKLHYGVVMMKQAVEGMEVMQPCFKENISYIRVTEQRKFETQQKAVASAQQQASAGLGGAVNAYSVNEISVKELIEAYARCHGLPFERKPNRMHNGYQIYGFGNVSIIIDSLNQKVYAQNEETWSLETLERLLELQNKSLSKRR